MKFEQIFKKIYNNFMKKIANEAVKIASGTTKTGKNTRRIMGIDPGLASTGWGIIDFDGIRFSLVDYGCIETKNTVEHANRLVEIYDTLQSQIDFYNPTESSMETLYFAKNVTSAMGVAEARGVVTLCLAKNNLHLGEYTPNTIKQSVTGTATADKKLVQNCVKLLLGMDHIPKPDHAADALAAAITHANSSVIAV